jgi:hypothetical protein
MVEKRTKCFSRNANSCLIALGNVVAVMSCIPRLHLWTEEEHAKGFRLGLG